ncbi:MAG: GMC family oxidoreductase [Chlamydiae bacterium]|nr:GMC family oxidoreductase [Chlamydiota bacterium]
MSKTEHYDVIIIGSGAGGGTLFHHLAASGKKILLLERGEYLRREKENWSSLDVFVEGRYRAKEPWTDKQGNEFYPGIHYYVGGNTKMYGAALLRMRERDFGVVKHHGGISPAWPIEYSEMNPYYLNAEKLYHVHGMRGSDPTEPPCAEGYPYPPIQHEPAIQKLFDDLRSVGRKPFYLPVGIKLDETNPQKSPCIKCNTCDGFPCLVDAKADAQIACIDPALKYPNVTLHTGCYVEKLETSSSGTEITSVIVERKGEKEIYKGDIIVVACGAINSAALLLRSQNHKYPRGLANGSDVVGRFYMCHNNSAMIALSLQENHTHFQKTMGINDFYYESPEWSFPMGHIQMLGKSDKYMFKADAASWVPSALLDPIAKRSIDFWLTTEDLPDPENRIILSKQNGIQLDYTPNNTTAHKKLVHQLKKILNEAGIYHHLIPNNAYIGKKIPLAGTAHQCGTVRFGNDPKTSALDKNCKSHEIDNLYVVDGSFFPSSSAVNPSLTIIANALRVGDHLLQRLRS